MGGRMILEHIPGSTFEKCSLPVVHVHPSFTQFFRQGHPFKELDLNPAAVYTKKHRTQRNSSVQRVATGGCDFTLRLDVPLFYVHLRKMIFSEIQFVVLETGMPLELVTDL